MRLKGSDVNWYSDRINGRLGLTEVTNKLFSIVVDETTFLYGLFYCCKVRVGEDHISGKFRDIGSTTHSDTDIGFLQCGGIVDTITGLKR